MAATFWALGVNMTDEDIDTLFEGETEEAEETEEVEEVEEAEEETKGETEESAPPADNEPKLVPLAVVHDERRKTQELKAEVERLKSQLPQDDDAPDPMEDLEGYNAYQRTKWEKEALQERIEKSRNKMLEEKPDYTDLENIFMVLSAQTPSLVEELNIHPDPARFAYEKGKAYLDNQKEMLRAEILSEQSPEPEEKPKVRTPNLATATAQASNTTPIEEEEAMDEMFGDMPY